MIIRASGERSRFRAATLATYTPENDEDKKTLRLALRLIETIGEYILGGRTHRLGT